MAFSLDLTFEVSKSNLDRPGNPGTSESLQVLRLDPQFCERSSGPSSGGRKAASISATLSLLVRGWQLRRALLVSARSGLLIARVSGLKLNYNAVISLCGANQICFSKTSASASSGGRKPSEF